jgi:hypothetical protein
MAYNTRETWIRSGPARDALESLSRQEGDHDARPRVWLAEDVRRQVSAAHGNRPAASEALAELFPSWFGGIDPSTGPEGTTEHGPPAGDSPGDDFGVATESVDPPSAIRSAGIRRPTEPRQRFMKVDSSWIDENLPVTVWKTNPAIVDEQIRELLGGPTGAGDEFEETWGTGPRPIDSDEDGGGDPGEFPRANRVAPELINRRSNRALTGREASVELMMSQPWARDPPLGARAIDAALPGASPPEDSVGSRSPPAIAGRSLEGKRGAESHLGSMADTSATSLAPQAMAALVEELERLRAAVRRTADELEKIRGPVPAAFPARPPDFQGRI